MPSDTRIVGIGTEFDLSANFYLQTLILRYPSQGEGSADWADRMVGRVMNCLRTIVSPLRSVKVIFQNDGTRGAETLNATPPMAGWVSIGENFGKRFQLFSTNAVIIPTLEWHSENLLSHVEIKSTQAQIEEAVKNLSVITRTFADDLQRPSEWLS